MTTTNTAPIKWAQRSDSLYLTIALPDVKNETINLTETALVFEGTSNGVPYKVDIAFYKKVAAADSTYKVLPRSIQMHILKATTTADDDENAETFWPRLLQDKALEKNQVKIDWDRYVDEDEEEEGFDTSNLEGGMGMGGGGMPGMPPGMGGMPGMGGGMPGGMDMNALMQQMGQMGGAGGMPGMPGDDEDEDGEDYDEDDDLPELEEAN